MFHEEFEIFDSVQVFHDELNEDDDSDEEPSVSDPVSKKFPMDQQIYPSVSSQSFGTSRLRVVQPLTIAVQLVEIVPNVRTRIIQTRSA